MPKSRPPYPAAYRTELVRLVREEGWTPFDRAKEFEPSAQSITNWVAQAEIDNGQRPGLTSDEKTELKRLRYENRVQWRQGSVVHTVGSGALRESTGAAASLAS